MEIPKKPVEPPPANISSGRDATSPKTVGSSVIEALRNGDHQAYDKVFYSYHHKVNGFVNSLVKCPEDAEDIVGDIFLSLWTNRLKLDPSRNFNSFLYTSAKNAVLNYFRNKKVRSGYLYAQSGEHSGESSDEAYIARETELLIKLTVAQMPQQRRKVFEMSREDGLSNNEIAQMLGISRKAVEKHIRLAIADIRKVIVCMLFFIG